MVQSFPFHTRPWNSRPIVISLMIVITLKKDAETGFIRCFNVLWGLPHPIHCCQFPAHLSLILYLLTCVWCSYVGVGVFLCLYCCRKRSSLYIKSPVPLLAHTPQTLKSTQEEMRGRGGEGGGRGDLRSGRKTEPSERMRRAGAETHLREGAWRAHHYNNLHSASDFKRLRVKTGFIL